MKSAALSLAMNLLLASALATTAFAKVVTTESPDALIVEQSNCSAQIGTGGNYVTPDIRIAGKCQGNGQAPLFAVEDNSPEIIFTTEPGEPTSKDRSELAFTNAPIPFGVPVDLSFEIRIGAGSSVTDSWFYLLQFWQPPATIGEGKRTRPPIAGLRMQRGSANIVSFIARSDNRVKAHPVAKMEFPFDQWVRLNVHMIVDPYGDSVVQIFNDGNLIGDWTGPMAFLPDSPANNWYRLKFGIYKGSEPDRYFEVAYRRVTLSFPDEPQESMGNMGGPIDAPAFNDPALVDPEFNNPDDDLPEFNDGTDLSE